MVYCQQKESRMERLVVAPLSVTSADRIRCICCFFPASDGTFGSVL